MNALRKVWRFVCLYGIGRTVFKVGGRSRRMPSLVLRRHQPQDIGLIGCGQFGVATLGYFLTRRFGRRLRLVYDTNPEAAQSAKRMLGARAVAGTADEILRDPQIKYVYIASNHASHTDYAVAALQSGKTVFVEKPVAVTYGQLARLSAAQRSAPGRLYAGYNRPFSAAVQALRQDLGATPRGGLSLSCFVSGHVIGPDHWYREFAEGTRICGNAGHWIDLFVHILAWRSLPDWFRIQMLRADPTEPDDNFALSIATDRGDVFTLMLTARSEPFEGINETVNFQQDDVIAKIDDFHDMTVWQGPRRKRRRFWPKDPGHKRAALQPFDGGTARDWAEVEASALLVLHITDMVRSGATETEFSRTQALARLDQGIEAA